MRIVLWATFAKAELIDRLRSILGDDLVVVSDLKELDAAIGDAGALLCPDPVYGAQVAEAVRTRAPRLRLLQLLTQGFEHAQANGVPAGITVCNAGDAYSPAVAMHAVALLLALQRRFPAMQANQMKREWNRTVSTQLTSPAGATIVILGFGSIGQEIARLVRAFGAQVVALTRSAAPHPMADEALPIGQLHAVLPRADVVVVALPLDVSTRHLIGARELALFRKTAVLVNISRGGIIDTAALVAALHSGAIAGAGLDVTDPEPLPAAHPLWAAPNLIISPHVAGAVGKKGFDRLASTAAKNVERFLAGKPLAHVITLERRRPPMRIVKIEDLHADGGWRTTSFLKLTTDEGLVGWSEYYEGFGASGVTDLIRRFAEVAKGMDPRDVGRLSTSLHAISRLAAGGMNHQAIAAIENACLDVKAKALDVPVYALFGGAMRDKLDLYWSHCGSFRVWRRDFFEKELGLPPIRTLDDVNKLGQEAVRRGYKALKTNPLPLAEGSKPFNSGFRIMPGFLDRQAEARTIGEICDVLAAFRDGAGPHMGIMFDLNFNQRTDGFLRIAQAVEEFKLSWLEIDIHDADALALIRRSTRTPIASLESLYGLKQYRPFLQQYAVDVAIVDVPWNGLWESMRIATLADAFEVDVAPHNFYGDLATLMSAHFCAAVPNFRIMEYEADDVPWRGEYVTHPPVVENGRLVVPTRPGWGADVNEEAVRARPPRGR